MQRFEILAYPRLHIALIGLNHGYRLNGGIGFSIEGLNLKIGFERAQAFVLEGFELYPENDTFLTLLEQGCERISAEHKYHAKMICSLPPHVGLGTGTLIRLALIEALFLVNNLYYKPQDVVTLSGRGGTSGIGVNAYFEGGLLMDSGRLNTKNENLMPSRYANGSPPLLVCREKMPPWRMGLVVPNFKGLSGAEEKLFFQQNTPISAESVYEVLYHSIYGLVSSVKEKDYRTWSRAVNNIQLCEWKAKERKIHAPGLNKISDEIFELGGDFVGMSSMGPSLYFGAPDISEVVGELSKNDRVKAFEIRPQNGGRLIIQ